MRVYTIGFTHKTAAEFFGPLRRAGIKRVLDVRLSNSSQLAGFTKRQDLPFFLRELCGAEYVHEPLLAPTAQIRDAYLKGHGDWQDYERSFLALMGERQVAKHLSRALLDGPTALLCAEPTAEHCHRRLVLEYLQAHWGEFEIVHL